MIRIPCILLLAAIAASAQSSPRFTVAATCADCHSALPSPAGAMQTTEPPLPVMLRHGRVVPMSSIGMYSLWQGSAMANSAIDPYWQARELEVDVTLRNLTGHKLPTAFPSRRMWLFVRVADANGATLFESGRPDPATGEIVGWDGDPAHRDEIVKPSQVAVYEAILADSNGVPTNPSGCRR